MFRRLLPLLPGLLLVLTGVAFADGPETGNITGTVTEASGTALPGVVVTLTGDRGSQTAVTGPDGTYRFGLVPPGSYTLQAEWLPGRLYQWTVDVNEESMLF